MIVTVENAESQYIGPLITKSTKKPTTDKSAAVATLLQLEMG